jgi:hypothetical protein
MTEGCWLDKFCQGTTLRASQDLAEVWKLKEAALNYVKDMHKV